MHKILLKRSIMLLIVLLLVIVQAYAMESATAEVSFTVDNAPGTVYIEAVGDAPLPEVKEYEGIYNGSFKMTYVEPDTYYYTIRQKAGSEKNYEYDNTVYNVIVTVLSDEQGNLSTLVVASKEGDAHKPDGVAFENIDKTYKNPKDNDDHEITPVPPPKTGDTSNLLKYAVIAIVSLIAVVIVIVFEIRSKRNK